MDDEILIAACAIHLESIDNYLDVVKKKIAKKTN
jgi:hypothetical protein